MLSELVIPRSYFGYIPCYIPVIRGCTQLTTKLTLATSKRGGDRNNARLNLNHIVNQKHGMYKQQHLDFSRHKIGRSIAIMLGRMMSKSNKFEWFSNKGSKTIRSWGGTYNNHFTRAGCIREVLADVLLTDQYDCFGPEQCMILSKIMHHMNYYRSFIFQYLWERQPTRIIMAVEHHPTVNCVGNRALPHAMCAASCVAKTHTLLEGLEAETLLHSGFENPLHLSSMKMMAPPHWWSHISPHLWAPRQSWWLVAPSHLEPVGPAAAVPQTFLILSRQAWKCLFSLLTTPLPAPWVAVLHHLFSRCARC